MTLVGGSRELPKNYQLVFDAVFAQPAGVHAAAASARRRQPSLGSSNVYRGLGRPRDLGLIPEVQVPGAAAAFIEPVRATHATLTCENCGRINDMRYGVSAREVCSLADRHAVEVTNLAATFNGRCGICLCKRADA